MDVDLVPSELLSGLSEMCSHFVQKAKASDQQARASKAEIEKLKKELANSRAAADASLAEVKKMKKEEKEKVKAVNLKGYKVGIIRAAAEYARVTRKMVNDDLIERLPKFYKCEYQVGANVMAGVIVIEPGLSFMKQLLEPVVVDLELPYTEEECQLFPPRMKKMMRS
ncbi:hypothetical protein RHMOL_Rhmol01G0202000 [Rhododendron molle]|uniref:Uncharacterized protein n=1 Tax=Rhododendron molle TaxID=49168 RepID=A0ACC0Q4X8_RHOML|nr:hypothetical protein RHMOL_Rhmol01G0202000 [Rhododendron molle]